MKDKTRFLKLLLKYKLYKRVIRFQVRTEHLCRKYAIFEWFPFVPYVEEAMSVTPAMLMPKPPKIPRMIYMVGGADKVVSKCYCLKEQRLGPVL